MNDHDHRHPYDGLDDDAIFADIIAHLNDDEAEVEEATQPAAQDAALEAKADDRPADPASPEVTPEAADDPKPEATPPIGPHAVPTPQLWRAAEGDGDDEEHFEPLPVSPLPLGDLQFWAILAGMVGGPLLLVYLVFFNRDASSYWTLAAIAMSVGGFGLLISRLPGQHEDGDDGARL